MKTSRLVVFWGLTILIPIGGFCQDFHHFEISGEISPTPLYENHNDVWTQRYAPSLTFSIGIPKYPFLRLGIELANISWVSDHLYSFEKTFLENTDIEVGQASNIYAHGIVGFAPLIEVLIHRGRVNDVRASISYLNGSPISPMEGITFLPLNAGKPMVEAISLGIEKVIFHHPLDIFVKIKTYFVLSETTIPVTSFQLGVRKGLY